MKKLLVIFVVQLFVTKFLQAQPPFEMSRNVYRVPYANGTDVEITSDHYTHNPVGRYDMVGYGNGSSCTSNYRIVAAASGVVRRVVDTHHMHGADCNGDQCTDFNNYIWIEHANGEWTKYTHIMNSSALVTAGLNEDDCITAGQFIGYECDIGKATWPHLHFEVLHPNDTAIIQISVAGGFMADAAHRIPVFCGIGKNYFEADDELTAASCGKCKALSNFVYSNTTFGANRVFAKIAGGTITLNGYIIFGSISSSMFKANNGITIKPGVLINRRAYFHARVGHCNTTSFTCS